LTYLNGSLYVLVINFLYFFSAGKWIFKDKTISEIKEFILNYVSNLLIFNVIIYKYVIIDFVLFKQCWNINDTTRTMELGENVFLTFYYCSPNYFKIKFNSYSSYNYELIYDNGTWSKIKKILSCNSNNNDEDIVNINGNLSVTGYIAGTASLSGGIARNFTYGLDNIKINKLIGYKLIAESSDNLSPTNPLNFYTAGFSYYDGFNGYQFICPYTTNNPLFYIRHLHNTTETPNDSPWFRLPVADEIMTSKNIGQNGYIKLGSLFGKLLIQYGRITINANTTSTTILFPISFTYQKSYSLSVNLENPLTYTGFIANTYIEKSVSLSHSSHNTARTAVWLAIGY